MIIKDYCRHTLEGKKGQNYWEKELQIPSYLVHDVIVCMIRILALPLPFPVLGVISQAAKVCPFLLLDIRIALQEAAAIKIEL